MRGQRSRGLSESGSDLTDDLWTLSMDVERCEGRRREGVQKSTSKRTTGSKKKLLSKQGGKIRGCEIRVDVSILCSTYLVQPKPLLLEMVFPSWGGCVYVGSTQCLWSCLFFLCP